MIYQVSIIAALVLLLAYAYTQRRRVPLLSAALIGLSVAGLVLAFLPDRANQVAAYVGIGRGADLVLYVFVVISLAAILNLHLRLRAQQESLTELARSLALLSVRRQQHHLPVGDEGDRRSLPFPG